MARYTDPVCRLCRREGVKLFLKGARCLSPKCALERREYPPGMHQYKRAKQSQYATQLREKQKLKRFYGILEAQFRRLFERAERSPGNTGEALLAILERRFDNILYRLGMGPSRAACRQLIRHGHLTVNGRPVDMPGCLIRQGDVIRTKPRPKSRSLVRAHMEGNQKPVIPDFLELTQEEQDTIGRVLRLPTAADTSLADIRIQLVVELLSK